MYLFKQRLEELIGIVIFVALIVGVVSGLMWLVSIVNQTVIAWVAFTIIVVFVLIIVFGFVYWLFIEPFKESMLYWKLKDKLKRK